jgi:hypothetical protein
MDRRATALLLIAAVQCGCGPSLKQIRSYVAHSPHRAIVLYPLDRQGGSADATGPAARLLESKLKDYGFAVTGRAKTQVIYSSSTLAGRAFTQVAEAVDYVKAWKAQAVLVGEVQGAYDAAAKTAGETGFAAVPPPACCFDRVRPCASNPVYDPMLQMDVPSCSGTHKKIVLTRASTKRFSGMSLRLRLVDAATRQTIWEFSYDVPREDTALAGLVDRVTDIALDEMTQAYLKLHL